MDNIAEIRQNVKEYYGRTIQKTKDLKTTACCSASLPLHIQDILKHVDAEILDRFYGCGSPIPSALEGCTVLDLGCGTGRDVYIVSKLVGEKGRVIGVDMIDEHIEIARKQVASQMRRFGFSKPNVEFKKGYIEDLKQIGVEDNSIDVIISNCVINLSADKRAVFSGIFRMLKPGGELYFSDVFAGRRIPEHLRQDSVLLGECLAGALYVEDFRRILKDIGCLDYRVVTKRRITLDAPDIAAKIGMIDFYSMTIRAFKLNALEDICEDYGQVATYSGAIPESPHQFILDDHHVFTAGKPMLVCGNTAAMLQETRYSKYFSIMGDRSTHYGPFSCAPNSDRGEAEGAFAVGSCC
jgi:ubiquinone/menaquinone biosynthesis C-methylase UbiE